MTSLITVFVENSFITCKFKVDGTGTVATDDRFKEVEESTSENTKAAEGATAVPINENLFLEEDLDGLDEELDGLDLEE